MRFSKRYRSFEDWLSTQDRHTDYIKRVARLHSLYPRASLDQLRDHAKTEAKRLSREHRISAKAVLKATNSFKRVKGRWKAKEVGHISRIMSINENGKELFIEVTDSRYATLIGKCHSAVKEYLNTGNLSCYMPYLGAHSLGFATADFIFIVLLLIGLVILYKDLSKILKYVWIGITVIAILVLIGVLI